MKLKEWIARQLSRIFKGSVTYQIVVAPAESGQTYPDVHSEEDSLATDFIFGSSPTLYAAVRAVANAIAMVPIRVIGPDGKERPNHPLQKLLDRPNDWDTTFDLMEQTGIFLEATGTMPWYLEGGANKGKPSQIIPLHPNRVTPVLHPTKKISGYEYSVDGRTKVFSVDEMILFRFFDPGDVKGMSGMGSMTPAMDSAIVDRLAVRFNRQFFKRGAVLSGVIETESEDIEPATMEKYVQQFRDRHAGSERAWDVRGLSHGLKWKPTQPTHTDMLFEKLRSMNREEMLMSVGVPPIMVTLLDGATYSNAQQQESAFWIATILPKIRKMEARLNRDLASRYGDVTIILDISDIKALQPDRTQIASVISPLLERRIINPNEARFYLSSGRIPKLDPVKHGEEFLTNFQITSLKASLDVRTPATPEVPPADTPPDESPEDDQVENLLATLARKAIELDIETRNEIRTRNLDPIRRASIRIFQDTSYSLFEQQRKAVLEVIERRKGVLVDLAKLQFPAKSSRFKGVMDDLSGLLDELENEYQSQFLGAYYDTVSETGREAMRLIDPDLTYHSSGVSATTFTSKQSGKLIVGIHEATLAKVQATLAEGLALGETNADLASRLMDVMGSDVNVERARMIAQTESNRSVNFGQVDAWAQTGGVVNRKMWVSSGDDKVRDTHQQADGQVVGLDETFTVGSSRLDYPGDEDHGADASEVIDCRCSMDPILASEAAAYSRNGKGHA